jgi:hypothetical protein
VLCAGAAKFVSRRRGLADRRVCRRTGPGSRGQNEVRQMCRVRVDTSATSETIFSLDIRKIIRSRARAATPGPIGSSRPTEPLKPEQRRSRRASGKSAFPAIRILRTVGPPENTGTARVRKSACRVHVKRSDIVDRAGVPVEYPATPAIRMVVGESCAHVALIETGISRVESTERAGPSGPCRRPRDRRS